MTRRSRGRGDGPGSWFGILDETLEQPRRALEEGAFVGGERPQTTREIRVPAAPDGLHERAARRRRLDERDPPVRSGRHTRREALSLEGIDDARDRGRLDALGL